MARVLYECENATKSSEDGDVAVKPFTCAPDKYCFYCCCNPQCCFVIPRRTPKHFWEAWYFWLGVALLLFIVLTTVGTYVVTNCKQNLQAIGYSVSRNNGSRSSRSSTGGGGGGPSTVQATGPRDPLQQLQLQQLQLQQLQLQQPNRNEISINIIPTSAVMSTHRKIVFIAPQPSCAHLTPIVA